MNFVNYFNIYKRLAHLRLTVLRDTDVDSQEKRPILVIYGLSLYNNLLDIRRDTYTKAYCQVKLEPRHRAV